jgi:hypothetical protein
MGQAADFFVSYTSADRAWGDWTAWQLEGEDDRGAGLELHPRQEPDPRDAAATATAEWVVAVLSANCLNATRGERHGL